MASLPLISESQSLPVAHGTLVRELTVWIRYGLPLVILGAVATALGMPRVAARATNGLRVLHSIRVHSRD